MDSGRVKPRSGLNLRDKPNGTISRVLSQNETLDILGEESFHRVRDSSGRIGYVNSAYLDVSLGQSKKSEFSQISFARPEFIGKEILCDSDFAVHLSRLGSFAKHCKLKIHITSSLRAIDAQVKGAIVRPATNSCHHIGHAIDMNIVHSSGFYNSVKLNKKNRHLWPKEIRLFIQLISRDESLRWGGDFGDPVHIDDNLYHRNPEEYKAKLLSRINLLNGIG